MIARVLSPPQRWVAAHPAPSGALALVGGLGLLGLTASAPYAASAALLIALSGAFAASPLGDDTTSVRSAASAWTGAVALLLCVTAPGPASVAAIAGTTLYTWLLLVPLVHRLRAGRAHTSSRVVAPPATLGLAALATAATIDAPAADALLGALSPALVALAWCMFTQRVSWIAAGLAGGVLGWFAALAGAQLAGGEATAADAAFASLGFAACVPLAVWHGLQHADTPPTWVRVGRWLGLPLAALAGAVLPSGPALGAGLGAAAACGFAVRRPARPHDAAAGEDLSIARRALHHLAPYFRWYGMAKLGGDPLYVRVAEQAGPWGRVLDVGAGTGLVSAIAAARHGTTHIHMVDLDHEKLRAARAHVERVAGPDTTVQVSAGAFPDVLESSSDHAPYNTVMLFDMLHYMAPETQRAVLAAARARLAPGGRILIRDAVSDGDTAGSIEAGEAWTTRFGFNPVGRTHFLSETEWRDQLAALDLTLDTWSACGDENVWIACSVAPGSVAPGA